MVDDINKITISETQARKKLNALKKLKNAVIKNKRFSSNQKKKTECIKEIKKRSNKK